MTIAGTSIIHSSSLDTHSKFTARTNAIGFPRITDALVKIYTHSIDCYTSTTPFPQPPKEDKVEDTDVKMEDPDVKMKDPVVVPPPVIAAPVVVAPPAVVVPKVEADEDDSEEEEVIKKPTKRRAPPAEKAAPVKKVAPAKKGGRKAKKVESSDEEFNVDGNEPEEFDGEFEEEPIPEDPRGEEKKAFRARHALDLVEIKRLIEVSKVECELTEKFMLKFFDEADWTKEDYPNEEQQKVYKAEQAAKVKAKADAAKPKSGAAKGKKV